MTVQVLTPVLEAQPRQTLSLRVRFENRSAEWQTVEPQLTVPSGWLVLVPPSDFSLDPGASRVVIMSVLVSVDAKSGNHTFPLTYYVSGEDERREALFTVTVPAIDRVLIRAVDEPEFVTAEAFETTFLFLNEGNTTHEWRLSASSSLGFDVRTVPDVVALTPGESAEVGVVATGPRPTRQTSHTLTLRAVSLSAPTISASGTSRTVLIPKALPASSAYHTFPLTAKLSYLGDSSGASSGEGAALEISGTGSLAERSEGQFRVDIRIAPDDLLEGLVVEYRLPEFKLLLGDQSFSTSLLTPSVNGFGVSASYETGPLRNLPVIIEVQGYSSDGTTGLTAGLSGDLNEDTDLSVTVNASSAGLLGSFAVRYTPRLRDPTVVQLGSIALTYGVRLPRGADLSHGFEVDGQLNEGVSFVRLRVHTSSAGFDRNDQHAFAVSLESLFRMNEPLRIAPQFPLFLSARYSTSWAWSPDSPFLFMPPSEASRLSEEYRVGVSFSAGRFSIAGSFSSNYEERTAGVHDKDLASLLASYRAPSGFALAQSVQLEQQKSPGSAMSRTLNYEAAAGIPTGDTGRLTMSLDGEYDLLFPRLDDLAFGVRWAGSLTESLVVGGGATVHLFNSSKLWDAQLRADYALPGDHALSVDVSVKAVRELPYSVKFELSYSVPLNVPLGRRPGIGRLAGRIATAKGEPIEGVVISVAGQSLTSGADGNFSFPALPVGEHVVQVEFRDVLAADRLLIPAPPQRITIAEGEEARIDFEVIKSAVVSGVLDVTIPERSATAVGDEATFEDANRGVRVELRSSDDVLYAITDAGGSFDFERVPPGIWTIRVVQPSLSTGFRLEPDHQKLDLRAGERERVEFTLIPVVRRIEFNVEETLVPPSGE